MATREELIGALRAADAAGDTASAQRIAAMISAAPAQAPQQQMPQQQAPQPDQSQQQPDEGSLAAGLNSAVDTGTMGLSNLAKRALAVAGAKAGMFGEGAQQQSVGDLWAATGELNDQRNQQMQAQHPYASLAGDAAGMVGGSMALAKGLEAAGVKAAKSIMGRLGQNAAIGAGTGAVTQAVDNGGVDAGTLYASILGGAAGAGGGVIADKVGSMLSNSKPWRMLVGKLQTPVADIQAFVSDYYAKTGKMPTIAQMFDARDQNILKGWAARSNEFGTSMRKAADAAPGQELGVSQLEAARKANMDAAMGSIRDTPVDLPDVLKDHPDALQAMRLEAPSIAPVNDPKAVTARQKIEDIMNKKASAQPLTIGELDTIRQGLRARQNSGSENARLYKDIADALTDHGTSTVPEYKKALDTFGAQSKAIEGFKAGYSGTPVNAAKPDVNTPPGLTGYQQGNLTREGQRALNNMAPGTPASADTNNLSEVGRGAAHVAYGSHGLGLWHMVRGIMPGGISEGQARVLAKGLLSRDPAVVSKTFANMKKAGATADQLRRIASGVAAYAGEAGGSMLAPDSAN